MFTGIAHVCFNVKSLDAMLDFYVNKLGCKKAFDFLDEHGKVCGFYIHIGGRTFIEMFRRNNLTPSTEQQNYAHLSIEVDDIQADTARLKNNGVAIGEISMGGDNTYQVWFADPEGNQIELHQYTPQSWQRPHLK